MEKKKSKKKQISLIYLIPVIAFVLTSVMVFANFAPSINYFFYDLFLRASKSPVESESIVLVDIDDDAIERRAVWPWRRGIYGDGLFALAEFGAKFAVFDIEFSEKSPSYVDPDFFQDNVIDGIDKSFDSLSQSINQLSDSFSAGRIKARDMGDYLGYTVDFIDEEKNSLISTIESGVFDNDWYFGKALGGFGYGISAVTLLKEDSSFIQPELYQLFGEKVYQDIKIGKKALKPSPGIRMVEPSILDGLLGLGFSNVVIDSDGKRRRVELFAQYKDYYVPQLAFAAVYNYLGKPELEIYKSRIVMKGGILDGQEVGDIVIPLDSKGRFLIKWPKKTFFDSYRHLSYWYLLEYIDEEKNLIHDIDLIVAEGYAPELSLKHPFEYVNEYKLLENYLLENRRDEDALASYRESKINFYLACEEFFSDENAGEFVNKFVSFANGLGEEEAKMYLDYATDLSTFFEDVNTRVAGLKETRRLIGDSVAESICIVGNTATSTTDRGVNPFDSEFENAGTHASVINSILNQYFIKEVHHYYSVLIALVLLLLITILLPRLKSYWQAVAGFSIVVVSFLFFLILFVAADIYIFPFEILLAQLLTVTGIYVYTFALSTKEKVFIRNAFGHYLSPQVIENIVANPESLQLGGQKKHMTAMFTDVKGFSTISEKLTPENLVKLLNMYLSDLSNVVLDLGGTIDKYEGDAIICFFGAPLDIHNHAELSCLAALKMKKAETNLNRVLADEGFLDMPLLTRIGINTGDMVVGNMGTMKKMDYTIMGNAVNLAARLEGVNKQYGTWLLISEDTYNQGGHKFLCRRLDRVRVVGISNPIRLYELVEEKEIADENTLKGVATFEEALDIFEKGNWKEAAAAFEKVYEFLPDDKPTEKFIKRCKVFLEKPPAENWDGVFNLTEK
ncbi:MAG: adenylate/guanylate cyclase domain-containing protein [Spirochaetales bacterium]|nr:adenylate/guanylate cyclase domain-containing protein [Spirochaetales bacterium]